MKKIIVNLLIAVPLLAAGCIAPPTYPPVVDADFPSEVCDPIVFPGTGVTADDINVAHTPGCGWSDFPEEILATCDEAIAAGIPDMRGIWVSYWGEEEGETHRIEQCGDRIVFSHSGHEPNAGIIHDMRTDGTYENGVNDIMDDGSCDSVSAKASIVNGKLVITRDPAEMLGISMSMSWGLYPNDKLESGMSMMGVNFPSRWRRVCEIPVTL